VCLQRLQQNDGALQRMQSNDEATHQRLDKIERILASNAHSMNAKQTQILELLTRTAMHTSGGGLAAAGLAAAERGDKHELTARAESHAGGVAYGRAPSSVSTFPVPIFACVHVRLLSLKCMNRIHEPQQLPVSPHSILIV
jgi:hypothetical protein